MLLRGVTAKTRQRARVGVVKISHLRGALREDGRQVEWYAEVPTSGSLGPVPEGDKGGGVIGWAGVPTNVAAVGVA